METAMGLVSLGLGVVVALGALGAWILNIQSGLNKRFSDVNATVNDFKLTVAQGYVPIGYLRDVEARLGTQMTRMENKLDRFMEKNGG